MNYFLIEGIVTHPEKMSEELMQKHQAYTNTLMKEGKVLFSSLKSDMSASVTLIKCESEAQVWDFYKQEPFYQNEVLTYKISQLELHYHTEKTDEWFI